MTRMSITVDEKLVEEVRAIAQTKTKREAIEQALREFVQRRRALELADLMGSDLVEWDVEDIRKWRDSGLRRL